MNVPILTPYNKTASEQKDIQHDLAKFKKGAWKEITEAKQSKQQQQQVLCKVWESLENADSWPRAIMRHFLDS